jgi:DNA-binding GntR family transcriptional regulator
MSRVSGVAEQVRVMILSGEIGLGEPIIDERLLERLRVRRGLLREALRTCRSRA